MKRSLLFFLAGLMSLGFFSTCKKGEDDPFLSLRTRNNRMRGIWNLTAANTEYTLSDSVAYEYWGEHFTSSSAAAGSGAFDGTEFVNHSSYVSEYSDYTQSNAYEDRSKYMLTIEILIDGTFILNERSDLLYSSYSSTYTSGGQTTTTSSDTSYAEGENFNEVNISDYWYWVDGAKNKMHISLGYLGLFYVKRLANKELVLESVSSEQSHEEAGTSIYRSNIINSSTLEFEKRTGE